MQYRIQRVSEVSSHAFRDLIILWLIIVFFTMTAAVLMSSSAAKADIFIPLQKVEMVVQPADFKSFTSFPKSFPTSALIQGRCQAHLHPQHNGTSYSNVTDRTQRNAETQGVQTVMAIKAYRDCVSQIVLNQLASK